MSNVCRLELTKQVSLDVVTINCQFIVNLLEIRMVCRKWFSSLCGSWLRSLRVSVDSHLYLVTKEQIELLFLRELEKT